MQSCLSEIRIDAADPRALYAQIEGAIRHAVAMRRLEAGEPLPSLRVAAEQWGVSLHTVRHAYLELEAAGLIEIRGTRGAFVVTPAAHESSTSFEAFLLDFLETARDRYGAGPADLADEILCLSRRSQRSVPVWVLECSATLREALASRIRERLPLEVEGWDVDDAARVPEGAIVSTYYHFNQVRKELPHRLTDLHFVAFRFDPRFVLEVVGEEYDQVVVCARDPALAAVIASEVRGRLPEKLTVRGVSSEFPGVLLEGQGPPVLFTPPLWDRLSVEERESPRGFCLGIEIDEPDLERLAQAFNLSGHSVVSTRRTSSTAG